MQEADGQVLSQYNIPAITKSCHNLEEAGEEQGVANDSGHQLPKEDEAQNG
jgi:hypothetical protein